MNKCKEEERGRENTMLSAALRRRLGDAGVVLASTSPRRREILGRLGLRFEVRGSTFEEDLDKADYSVAGYVEETAYRKAVDVRDKLAAEGSRPGLIISSDTVVVLDGRVMEKPGSEAEAVAMIRSLSGRENVVYTAVVLLMSPAVCGGDEPRAVRFHETTRVRFSELSDAVVADYVASGEPMDKAGGYGIQGAGGSLVSGIVGCHLNVVGFPLNRFCRELTAALGAGQP